MAISFVAESHSPGLTGYASSVTVNKPTGTTEGDLLFAFIGGTRSGSVPSGWTQLLSEAQGTSTGTVYLYYKFAGASEPSSYTFNFVGTKYSKTHTIVAYRGVDPDVPIGSSNSKEDSGTVFDTPSITATTGQWIVSFASQYSFASGSSEVKTWTINTGTQRADYGQELNNDEDAASCWFDSNGGVSSGSTSRTHTASSSCTVGMTGILSLNEADSGYEGVLSGTLPELTGTFTGEELSLDAQLTATLPALNSEFTAFTTVDLEGSFAVDLPALTASLTGHRPVDGSMAATLPTLTANFLFETKFVGARVVVVINDDRTLRIFGSEHG